MVLRVYNLRKVLLSVVLIVIVLLAFTGIICVAAAEASGTQALSELPIGAKVVDTSWEWEHLTGEDYSGTGETKPVIWVVVAKDHYGNGSGVTLLTEEVIGKHAFDNSKNDFDSPEGNTGSNHWGNSGRDSTATSGLRPWLNSTGIHAGEGFYSAFSPLFQSAIIVTTLPNKVWDTGNSYHTEDKVFIPSTTELGDEVHSHTYQVGAIYPYFLGAENELRIANLGSDSCAYWTRSPNRHFTQTVRQVSRSGEFALNYDAFNYHVGVRPALNLQANTLVSETENEDGAYEILYLEFTGGDGTAGDPWRIKTAHQLNNVRNYLGSDHADKHFRLDADIDLDIAPYNTGEGWEPIGSYINRFMGQFDGAGKTISNLYIDRPSEKWGCGLFGETDDANILNVNLINFDIKGESSTGGLIGGAWDTTIINCHVSGDITGTKDSVGGLAGDADNTTITSSSFNGAVSGEKRVGGLAGIADRSSISGSFTTGTVTGADYVGGLVGDSCDLIIYSSYSTASVTGTADYVGGLVGYSLGLNIDSSYSTGSVESTGNYVGGLVGVCYHDEYSEEDILITGSTASGNVAGNDYVGGLIGAYILDHWETDYSTIVSESSATGDVSGNDRVGGLIGSMDDGSIITQCFASGSVTSSGEYIGGLVGYVEELGEITDCYTSGNVNGHSYVGGLVGHNEAYITNTYASGLVSSSTTDNVGGLIGDHISTLADVEYSYYDSDTTGQNDDEGKGTPKTTVEMKTGMPSVEIYTDWSTDVWSFTPTNKYPWLINNPEQEPAVDPSWSKLTPVKARALDLDSGKLAGSFDGFGIWHYDGDWLQLTPETAEVLAYDSGVVIASFDGLGVWVYDGNWTNLTTATARAMAADDGKIVISLDELGIWLYNDGWANLAPFTAKEVALEGNTLVASFDELGIWRYDGEWTNLAPVPANKLAISGGTILASIDGSGLWSFDGEWINLTTATARAITSKDGKIAASFDELGIWFYDGEWTNIAPITAGVLAYENEVLAASFESHGVWLYE